MIKADDAGLITRIYRLQKLLRPTPEAAAESTCELGRCFATKDQILEVIAAEEKRRGELMQILRATQKELLDM